ncbi:AAA family ATPase [Bacillus sp. JJ1503]|uniref:deoxynucleotide monophosphate kinase family protein n=1 Tax=Bacillus sp. JJ1503 TaxID=3122956 RepID=UPI003000E039
MNHTIEVSRKVIVTKICLCGKLRAGKDAVAQQLYLHHGFDKVAFGDALKRVAHETFPWVSEFSKPRALYQQVGQLMREIEPDVWIRHVERRVESFINIRKDDRDRVGIVVTDLRQPNEYEWARANGFTIIRVTAPEADRLLRAKLAGDDFSEADLAHETESHVDGFTVDFEVVNDGTVEELHAKVDAIMAEINAKGAV